MRRVKAFLIPQIVALLWLIAGARAAVPPDPAARLAPQFLAIHPFEILAGLVPPEKSKSSKPVQLGPVPHPAPSVRFRSITLSSAGSRRPESIRPRHFRSRSPPGFSLIDFGALS